LPLILARNEGSLDVNLNSSATLNAPRSAQNEILDPNDVEMADPSSDDEVYLSGNENPQSDQEDSFLLSSSDDEDEVPFVPPDFNRGRRTSISAESMAPTQGDNFEKVTYPKSEDQRNRIEEAISNNFLFKHLDEEQYKDVIDAMMEKRVEKNEEIITQGGVGDYFYVVESGTFDALVAKEGNSPIKVLEYSAGGSFGELALMYNAPRAATVLCTSDATLWALDRITFRRILMEQTSRKRRMYESFLEEVQVLISLEPYERHKIADALESQIFHAGEVVIRQGDVGEGFYIIESGTAKITIIDENGVEKVVNQLSRGDYFGELALLNDKPRIATVTADTRLKVATLGKKAFVRLLGPAIDILKRNESNYDAITNDTD
jgi:cAMP-dependent protein kinase regulator